MNSQDLQRQNVPRQLDGVVAGVDGVVTGVGSVYLLFCDVEYGRKVVASTTDIGRVRTSPSLIKLSPPPPSWTRDLWSQRSERAVRAASAVVNPVLCAQVVVPVGRSRAHCPVLGKCSKLARADGPHHVYPASRLPASQARYHTHRHPVLASPISFVRI